MTVAVGLKQTRKIQIVKVLVFSTFSCEDSPARENITWAQLTGTLDLLLGITQSDKWCNRIIWKNRVHPRETEIRI